MKRQDKKMNSVSSNQGSNIDKSVKGKFNSLFKKNKKQTRKKFVTSVSLMVQWESWASVWTRELCL